MTGSHQASTVAHRTAEVFGPFGIRIGVAALIGLMMPGSWAGALRAAYVDRFEGPVVSWRAGGGDAPSRIVDHRRIDQAPHSGARCELVQVASASSGTAFYLVHPIQPARVIGELTVSVWVRANRPGIRLLVRVVLPRNRDPKTGQAMTTLLIGPASRQPGRWEPLQLAGIPRQLERQIRAMRVQYGPQIDPREAYVDQVLLNLHCGPGPTSVAIDDLTVDSHIAAPAASRAPAPQLPSGAASRRLPPVDRPARTRSPSRRVEIEGPVLLVDGRPVFPRAIEYQGEPLAALKQLGFDFVLFSRSPDRSLLREAERLGMWLICPPPPVASLDQQAIDTRYDAVVAWYMGRGLASPELGAIRQWCRRLRQTDPRDARPILGFPSDALRAYSRQFDMLITGRDVIGTSQEVSDYATWLSHRPRLALPGTPIWTRVQTELPVPLEQQAALLSGRAAPAAYGSAPETAIDHARIALLTRIALATGSRGLIFTSRHPLTGGDPASQQRAMALEQINLELQLIEPWTAGETTVTAVASSNPRLTGALLQSPGARARLLIPLHWNPWSQYVSGATEATRVTFVVPGIPEAWKWYALTPVDLVLLPHKRVAGGVRVTVNRCDPGTVVLMTPDPLVIRDLKQQLARKRQRTLELMRNLAIYRSRQTAAIERQLAARLGPNRAVDQRLAAAETSLQQVDRHRASADHLRAYTQASMTLGALASAQRLRWEQVVRQWPTPVSSPLAMRFDTLPADLVFFQQLKQARWGANRLPGGDFEDLASVRQVGWTHHRHQVAGVQSRVTLAEGGAHSGRSFLRIATTATAARDDPQLVASAPVWIVTPAVHLEAGQLVRIDGWLRIPEPIRDSVDGLMIVDSLGGPALARRVGRTDGWQQFTLYRAAGQTADLTVTFALSGLGSVDIDAVTITPFAPGPSPLPPQTARTPPPARLPSVR